MNAGATVLAADITPGEHETGTILGMTVNLDTLWVSGIVAVIIIGLGFWMRFTVKPDGVPGKLQLVFETVVAWIEDQVESAIGKVPRYVVPLAVTLFFFILACNWIAFIPSGHHPEYLPAPTSDVNVTYALAILVIILVHASSIKRRGIKQYIHHYFEPYPYLFPILLIEEIVKPFTLALRLFGNIFSGGIMVALITLFPSYILWGPNAIWKTFDLAIGLIQAFIFALLTVLYFAFATTTHGDEEAAHA